MTYGRFEEQLERLCSVRQGLTSGIAVPCSLYTLPDAIMTKCKGQRTYSALPLRRTERQAAAFACFARSMASIMICRASEELPQVQIGRAHVCTPVTNAHPVCRRLFDKKIQ